MSKQDVKVRKAFRQGELLFVPLSKEDMESIGYEPEDTSYPQWNALKTNILREGEATGHKHEVITQTPGAATLLAPASTLMGGLSNMAQIGSADRLLVAKESVEVVHPEHKPLRLLKGVILVVVQREYDEVKARRVTD
jgi:hypothetical protein